MKETPNIMRPPQFALTEFIALLPEWGDAVMAEIGCYQGESTEAFAKTGKFKKIYAIDPWSNERYDENDLATMHCDMVVVEAAFDERMAPYPFVQKVKGRSSLAAQYPMGPCLDFVYIDADHRYESVKQDITLWLPKLKGPGSIISGHDYGTHPGIKKAVDEIFGRPHNVTKDYSWMVRL